MVGVEDMPVKPIFCSTIIPTIGRTKLARSVNSLLDQNLEDADYEVIVVNDSGQSLASADWQSSHRIQVITTQKLERSAARNTGAALARGKYLHFLDDDDWLLPGALSAFWNFSRTCDADWIYGGEQLVDREGNPSIKYRPDLKDNCFLVVMAGELVHLQASLIKKEVFFEIGGFDPLLVGPEDNDLLRKISLHGNLAGFNELVAVKEMGRNNSLTDYDNHSIRSRQAREKILSMDGVFTRLKTSASSRKNRGLLARIYLSSVIWNFQHRRFFTALSRLTYGLAGMAVARGDVISKEYWSSMVHSYQGSAFAKGIQEAKEKLA